MQKFKDFVGKKERDARKELGIIKKILEKNDYQVSDFLEEIGDPHIFVKAPNTKEELSFEGIRVYKIGSDIAYRVQNEEKTQPYGKAYTIPVEEMYNDFISDKFKEEKAGQEVMESVFKEIERFFTQSLIAEKQLRSAEIEKNRDQLGRVIIGGSGTGTDYSNLISKTNVGSPL